MVKNA
jgi:hypothetical protein